MVRLTIDGTAAELERDAELSLSFSDKEFKGVKSQSNSEIITMELVSSVVNDTIFATDGYLHAAQRYNAHKHYAEVESEGQVVARGELTLVQVEWHDSMAHYTVEIATTAVGWALNAELGWFSDIDLDIDFTLNMGCIKQSWSEETEAVKFIAVHRDSYDDTPSSVSTETVRRLRSIDEYHPFLHVATLFEAIVSSGGYEIQSSFMQSEEFQSLYMSGAYSSSAVTSLASEKMDFRAKKMESVSTTADSFGRVFLTEGIVVNSVGSIIDVESIDQDSECYARGGCLTLEDGVPTFKPLTQVSVGFEYRLKYTTPYVIESRTRLKAFDKLMLCDATVVEYEIVNRFEDRKENILPFFEYRIVVFDYNERDTFRLWAKIDGSEKYTLLDLVIERNTATFTTPNCSTITDYRIDVRGYGSMIYRDYLGDWALYDGYIDYEGVTEVDITVRTPPRVVSPTSPVEFVGAFISGGEHGWDFTLLEGSSLTPYFAKYPGYGETLEFATIAQHRISQSKFMESIAHMYNLRFFSDRDAKVVYIEPYNDMYSSSEVWDWSDKIDTSVAIVLTDWAKEYSQTLKLGYQPWDGTTNRGDYPHDSDYDPTEFGVWSRTIASQAASQSRSMELNPVFSPSHNDAEELLIVGDRDDADLVDSLDFAPRIVRLCDTIVTHDGEMPYITFYDAERGVSLCFEDRDGVEGLNQYYTPEVELWERARVVTLNLKLSPSDFWALRSMEQGVPSAVSTFILNIGGERARCRLKSIDGYNPMKRSTKCRFIVIS